jgi:antitoxin component YwqK of YwqJK toxin-antitoxin module
LQYDDNENLIAIANYKDDQKHGKWAIWDSNGVKRVEMNYEHGKRTGTWSSWSDAGELISSKTY